MYLSLRVFDIRLPRESTAFDLQIGDRLNYPLQVPWSAVAFCQSGVMINQLSILYCCLLYVTA